MHQNMSPRRIVEADEIQYWRRELSQSFAQANWDQFAQTTQDAKEMWHGGGQLSPGQSGPGIRADRFRAEAARRFFDSGFDCDQKRRLRLYQALLADVANGVDPQILGEELLRIYERFSEDLERGGFLVEAAVRRVRAVCAEELGQWDMMIASL